MRWLRVPLQLSLALLIAVAACSPAATPAPPTPAPPTQSAPTETPTPLIAATVEVTAEATSATEEATTEMTVAATEEATAAATETGLISTREATAEAISTAESTSSAQMFMIRQTGAPAACAITPTGGDGVNIRQAPTKDSALLGGLLRGAWVVAKGVNQTGTWFQISAPGTPADGGWITRQNVALRRGCSCVIGGLCRPDATATPKAPSSTPEATP